MKIYIPNNIQEHHIYDIFYNDDNELIIIIAAEIPFPTIEYLDHDNKKKFQVNICSHKHTYIYKLQIPYKEEITLIINDTIVNTYVNKYPTFPNEIIFSTLVKNEDNYIVQWIEYHFKNGISRFIIYDNSESNTLTDVLKSYIEKNTVILIKWLYPYLLNISGFSAQTTQQNHSIYAFSTSKYIGLFDVDEYVNNQKPLKINDMLENIIEENNINITKISGFKLLNKFFYNPDNLPTDGYNFLNIYNCDNISKYGQEKCLVIPKNVSTFSVHCVTNGLEIYNVDEKYMYFNHYYFLNKLHRGYNKTDLIDDSIKIHL